MTELRTIFFRNAAGEVREVKLPEIEARNACRKHPHEWSFTPDTFAPAPEGFVGAKAMAAAAVGSRARAFASIEERAPMIFIATVLALYAPVLSVICWQF